MLKIFKSIGEKLGLVEDKSKEKKEQKREVKHQKSNKKFDKREISSKKDTKPTKPKQQNSKPKRWSVSEFVVEEKKGETRFHDFHLPRSIMHAIYDLGFKYCTPIQGKILEDTLKGRDAIGKAQTGTGKTAAFLITIFTKLIRTKLKTKRKNGTPRALIIAPTRELVMQISKDAKKIGKYNKFSVVSVYGGMDYKKQKERLRNKPVDILVATTGRLIDFMKNRDVDLSNIEVLVLDECDAMLDMGFIPDVKKVIKATPYKDKRQTLFFSATVTTDVENLASLWTKNPVKVEIEPEQVAVKSVEKLTYTVMDDEKYSLLFNLFKNKEFSKALIFCNRKTETEEVYKKLYSNGIDCALLSGDIDQKFRVKTLDNFKDGNLRALIATDVASRGIHIPKVTHVINYTLPENPEDYVHRIGRTGRAGETGVSINLASEMDSFNIPIIEDFIGEKLECLQPESELLEDVPDPHRKPPEQKRVKRNYNNKNNRNRKRRYNKDRSNKSNKPNTKNK